MPRAKGERRLEILKALPAVLIEVGFLTNQDEARRLRDDRYLEQIAQEIARGVERYRGEQETLLARAERP